MVAQWCSHPEECVPARSASHPAVSHQCPPALDPRTVAKTSHCDQERLWPSDPPRTRASTPIRCRGAARPLRGGVRFRSCRGRHTPPGYSKFDAVAILSVDEALRFLRRGPARSAHPLPLEPEQPAAGYPLSGRAVCVPIRFRIFGCVVNPLPEVKQSGQCAQRTRQVVAERLRQWSM
jgi:hypothetical protein